MVGFLWAVLVACALLLIASLRGRLFVDPERNRRASAAIGVVAGLSVLALLGSQMAQSAESSKVAAQRAAEARALHEQHLAWQRSHPKEYAAMVARSRANAARQAAAVKGEQERQEAQRHESDRIANLPENKDPCNYANGRVTQGWADFNGSAYQAAFDDAVKGITANEHCDDEDMHQVNEGFLLSVKGMSEHYLSSGDSRTDLNQAETVLEECQTNPHFYGTHTGAVCETQQENDIKATTNWEVYGG